MKKLSLTLVLISLACNAHNFENDESFGKTIHTLLETKIEPKLPVTRYKLPRVKKQEREDDELIQSFIFTLQNETGLRKGLKLINTFDWNSYAHSDQWTDDMTRAFHFARRLKTVHEKLGVTELKKDGSQLHFQFKKGRPSKKVSLLLEWASTIPVED